MQRNKRAPATPDYTMGFGEGILEHLRRHSAEASAAYLLPYLRPGLRVLDFGCGPGSISVGLARAVAPGEMHGVDMEESQINMARSLAAAMGQDNAMFHVGEATDLPFEDNFFDVAHCYNVLMHIPDTGAVLAEVKRVLKPGGIIGCREIICDSSFTHPDFGVLKKAWDMFADLLEADDGHSQMGKDMGGYLMESGFANVRTDATFNVYSTPEDIVAFDKLVNRWFLSSTITEAATKYGAATAKLFDDIRDAHKKWTTHPGAIAAIAYGEAVANKP